MVREWRKCLRPVMGEPRPVDPQGSVRPPLPCRQTGWPEGPELGGRPSRQGGLWLTSCPHGQALLGAGCSEVSRTFLPVSLREAEGASPVFSVGPWLSSRRLSSQPSGGPRGWCPWRGCTSLRGPPVPFWVLPWPLQNSPVLGAAVALRPPSLEDPRGRVSTHQLDLRGGRGAPGSRLRVEG